MAVSLDTLRAKHPDWNIVDYTVAPNGGIWAIGADGGVFTLNAEGDQGEGEAPFLGSYPGLEPQQRQGERSFEGIRAEPEGYTLVSNIPGQTYYFGGLPSTPITPPADLGPQVGAAPEVVNPADQSGKALFNQTVIDMGFTPAAAAALADQLWNPSKIKSPEELMIDLRGTKEYKERFAGLVALRDRAAKGEYIPHIPTEDQYVTLEGGMRQEAIKAGLPPTFYDSPSDFATLIGGGVSVAEYSSRVSWAQQAALGTDPTLRDELARLYNADLGNLTAFFLDPAKGQEVLEQQVATTRIGAASKRSGFGMLSQAEIDTLRARGLGPEQATSAMAGVAALSPLEAETAGESRTGDELTRAQQLGTATGEGADVAAFERRRRARQAAFEGGGGAAGGGAGATGLGSAR